jgi:hypothetical protein
MSSTYGTTAIAQYIGYSIGLSWKLVFKNNNNNKYYNTEKFPTFFSLGRAERMMEEDAPGINKRTIARYCNSICHLDINSVHKCI